MSPHRPPPQPEAPVVITDADLPHVGQVVDTFLGAVGNGAALHFLGRELAFVAVALGAGTSDISGEDEARGPHHGNSA